MKTVIVYYSAHHGNTKKLLDAIAAADEAVELVDVTSAPEDLDLSSFDRIGFASGIYFSAFAKQVLTFAEARLPENKDVFCICTHGAPKGVFFKSIAAVISAKHCREIGRYDCLGFDTFGPFKLVGGLAKGHPTAEETDGAVAFYRALSGNKSE